MDSAVGDLEVWMEEVDAVGQTRRQATAFDGSIFVQMETWKLETWMETWRQREKTEGALITAFEPPLSRASPFSLDLSFHKHASRGHC